MYVVFRQFPANAKRDEQKTQQRNVSRKRANFRKPERFAQTSFTFVRYIKHIFMIREKVNLRHSLKRRLRRLTTHQTAK